MLNCASGVSVKPSNAALMSASVPVNVIPLVVLKLNVPYIAMRVHCIVEEPASMSETVTALPLAAENTRLVPCAMLWEPGSEITGALLTASPLLLLDPLPLSPLDPLPLLLPDPLSPLPD